MLKAALIAVLGLGFGTAAQAQAADDGTILGCQPSQLEARFTSGYLQGYGINGQDYSFCPETGLSDNPAVHVIKGLVNGEIINASGANRIRSASIIARGMPRDELEQLRPYIERIQAHGYGRGLGPITDSRFQNLRPID